MREIKNQTLAQEVYRYELESWSSTPPAIDFHLKLSIFIEIGWLCSTGRMFQPDEP